MRRHAAANRERILVAADAVFGAHGALGSTEDVAERAGVGIATVFRHFPTKQALIEAALVRHFNRINELATELSTRSDPAQALRELLTRMVETGATKLTLASVLGELPPDARAAATEVRATMQGILERAQAAGAVRDEVTIDELYVLLRGLAETTATMPSPPATLRRAVDIIWRGIAV